MRSIAVLAVVLLAATGLPAWGQDDAAKARLDDFAVSTDDVAGPRIEQLGDQAQSLPQAGQQTGDRELAIPGPPPGDRSPVTQLTDPGEAGRSQQLSERAESRQLASGSVSSAEDSRPRAAGPLGGADRCDPQLESEQLARCQQILERRAAEFDAPEPPRLSAEQVLLAERGANDERLASRSSDLRLKLAAGDPDAEITSNQELASIYLDRSSIQGRPSTAEEPTVPDEAKLIEILQGLQIDVPGGGAP